MEDTTLTLWANSIGNCDLGTVHMCYMNDTVPSDPSEFTMENP